MIKKIITILIFVFFINVSLWADNDYLEDADIPWTDVINFNWQFENSDGDTETYRVYINTWDVFYVTWSDDKLHNCFEILWTWYTEKLWAIYFQYDWHKWYLCDDYKLRWVFKIEAWWWGYLEDLENSPEEWKLFLNKIESNWYYYHSEDWDWNWDWQSRLEWIGYANWNSVKTKLNINQLMTEITVKIIINPSQKVYANWTDEWDIAIRLLYNNKALKNFKVDEIYFSSGLNSDVEYQWKKIAALTYLWDLKTDDHWVIRWHITSLNWKKDLEYRLNIKFWDHFIQQDGTTSIFKYPFEINTNISANEIANKTVVWYKNKVKLSVSKVNIDSINFSNINTNIVYSDKDYFKTILWENIDIETEEDLKIIYKKFYSQDKVKIQYNITWDYLFTKDWKSYKIYSFNTLSNEWYLYKYWKIFDTKIYKENNNITADGKTSQIFKILFFDENNIHLNNIDFDLSINDINKKFNLNIDDNNYETWFIVNKNFNKNTGIYKIWLISYKPVNKWKLEFKIINPTYTWAVQYTITNSNETKNINNITFQPVVSNTFKETTLKINVKNNLDYTLSNDLWNNIESPKYIFTWYAIDCDDCEFKEWKEIKWNQFETNNFDVLIESDDCPSKVVYSWVVSYTLSWIDWKKRVNTIYKKNYDPLLFIESWIIKVLWNIWTNKKIIKWIKYIATNINPNYLRNKLKKLHYKYFIKWSNITELNTDTTISLSSLSKTNNIYKCNNNILTINWTYNHNINLYTLWCKINIEDNIISNWWHLNIYAFSNNKIPDIEKTNWWDIAWNIYIKSNVKTIQASLITEWSIFTYKNNIDKNNIFVDNRNNDNSFKWQLYIKWKVYSKNTLWWWNKYSNWNYSIVNWKIMNENEWKIWNKSIESIAKAYDLSFLKGKYVKEDWTYDTNNLSEYIKNKYNCSWDSNTDNEICTTILVIEDSK